MIVVVHTTQPSGTSPFVVTTCIKPIREKRKKLFILHMLILNHPIGENRRPEIETYKI